MPWYHKLARWIEKRGGCRRIYRTDGDEQHNLYLERFYILKTPWCELMIHRFHLGDVPIMHDHPWDSANVILEGGYLEHVLEDGQERAYFRKPGYFGQRKAEDFHWVELMPGSSSHVWTVFGTFRRRKDWGFLTPEGYVDADEHFVRTGVDKVNQRGAHYKGWLFPVRG
jgi:hypothetical protein